MKSIYGTETLLLKSRSFRVNSRCRKKWAHHTSTQTARPQGALAIGHRKGAAGHVEERLTPIVRGVTQSASRCTPIPGKICKTRHFLLEIYLRDKTRVETGSVTFPVRNQAFLNRKITRCYDPSPPTGSPTKDIFKAKPLALFVCSITTWLTLETLVMRTDPFSCLK
jgi:hypothetical protein